MSILKGPEGEDFKVVVKGPYNERVIACLAGDYTLGGVRVGIKHATLAATAKRDDVDAMAAESKDPAVVAAKLADDLGLTFDGALTKELSAAEVVTLKEPLELDGPGIPWPGKKKGASSPTGTEPTRDGR